MELPYCPAFTNMRSISVLDTNFLLHNLSIVERLLELAPHYKHTIIVPFTVSHELDGLKKGTSARAVSARQAITWLFKQVANSSKYIRGQRLVEIIDTGLKADASILDCCRYFELQGNLVVLLSNDVNLCVQALSNSIKTVSCHGHVTAELIAQKVAQEAGIIPTQEESMDIDAIAEAPTLDADMEIDDLHEVYTRPPSPLVLGQTEFSSMSSFDRAIKDVLLKNANAIIEYKLRTVYDKDAYEYYVRPLKEITPQSLLKRLEDFKIAVFIEFLPGQTFKRLHKIKANPTSKSDWADFIDAWGSVCLQLSNNDPRYRKTIDAVQEAYTKCYTPPSR